MLRESFEAGHRVHVVLAERGYPAFVPPPLPPRFDLTPALVNQLSAADRALGQLAGAGQGLPNPHLISRVLLRREAVLSSRIEGTRASLSELVLFEVEQPRHATGDVREVHTYLLAIEHVLDPDTRLPLSLSLLREAHRILLTGVPGGYATPGDFRTSQNWMARRTRHWTAPPMSRRRRLLLVMLLLEWGLLPAPLLDQSANIEPRRDWYYRALTPSDAPVPPTGDADVRRAEPTPS